MSWHSWAAGFIDGEGCITLGHNRRTEQVYLQLTASQNCKEPLLKLQELFGGAIEECCGKRKNRHFLWRVVSGQAITVIRSIRPWLLVKGDQADLAEEFWEKCSRRQGYNLPLTQDQKTLRLKFVGEIHQLNHRAEPKLKMV